MRRGDGRARPAGAPTQRWPAPKGRWPPPKKWEMVLEKSGGSELKLWSRKIKEERGFIGELFYTIPMRRGRRGEGGLSFGCEGRPDP